MPILLGLVLTLIAIALLFVVVVGVFYVVDIFLELPYVGAKKNNVDDIFKLAGLKKGETVVDLGSGDGRLLFKSAEFGAFAHGYEVNPFLILISVLKMQLKGLNDLVKIKDESMWKADLKIADVILVYSLKKKMEKFEDFIYQNAKKGTRVVVNTNSFPNKKPNKTLGKIFLYVI